MTSQFAMSEEYISQPSSAESITEDYVAANRSVTGFLLPFSNRDGAIVTGLVLPMAIFAIVSNVITIFVVKSSPKLNSIFHLYMISLCVSDTISALLSPFYLNQVIWEFNDWKISNFLCKMYLGGDKSTSVATSFHIVMYSLLRFISITRPHEFRRIKLIHAKINIFCIWAVSLGGGFITHLIWFGARIIDRSVETIDSTWPSCSLQLRWIKPFLHFTHYGFTIFFYIPLILIFVLSLASAVAICVFQRKRKNVKANITGLHNNVTEQHRQRKEKQAIVQLAFIVGSFALGFIPKSAFCIFISSIKAETHEDIVLQWRFSVGSYLCLRFSECLNPVFYNLSSSNMREETFTWLRNLFGIKKPRNASAFKGITLHTINISRNANQRT